MVIFQAPITVKPRIQAAMTAISARVGIGGMCSKPPPVPARPARPSRPGRDAGQVEREPGPAGDDEVTEHAVGQVSRSGRATERDGRDEPGLTQQDA